MRPKTSLVHLTQSKGRVCQGCDVYVGPKVNNSEWISLQSLWSNPFDLHDLTPMWHNEMYSRHIDHTPYLRNSLHKLVGKHLGCLCSDHENCHGHILVKKIKEKFPPKCLKDIFCGKKIFFKGEHSVLSNCYKCEMKMKDGLFMNAHQYYVWRKATTMGEKFIAKSILECENVKKIFKWKRLLDKQPFKWCTKQCVKAMYDVLETKWEMVPKFKSMCLRTLDCMFFKATRDFFWGCGIDLENIDEKRWLNAKNFGPKTSDLNGMNMVGWLIKILTVVKVGTGLGFVKKCENLSPHLNEGLYLALKILAEEGVLKLSSMTRLSLKKKKPPVSSIL